MSHVVSEVEQSYVVSNVEQSLLVSDVEQNHDVSDVELSNNLCFKRVLCIIRWELSHVVCDVEQSPVVWV